MNANEKGFKSLLKLALKFLVKDEGDTATCLHCGYKGETKSNSGYFIPLYQHIKEHILRNEITANDILGRR
jgi:hypothetical protein